MFPRLWTSGARCSRAGRCFGFLQPVGRHSLDERMGICGREAGKTAFSTRAPQNQTRNSEVAVMQPDAETGSQIGACEFGRRATSLGQETA
jgi:hypothetical protein